MNITNELPEKPGWHWCRWLDETDWAPIFVYYRDGELCVNLSGHTPLRFIGSYPVPHALWGGYIPKPNEDQS